MQPGKASSIMWWLVLPVKNPGKEVIDGEYIVKTCLFIKKVALKKSYFYTDLSE